MARKRLEPRERITYYERPTTIQALEAIMKRRDLTLSDVLRLAAREFVEREAKQQPTTN